MFLADFSLRGLKNALTIKPYGDRQKALSGGLCNPLNFFVKFLVSFVPDWHCEDDSNTYETAPDPDERGR
jgi:hypothetical protein